MISETFIDKLEKQIDDIYPFIEQLMDNSTMYYRDLNAHSDSVYILGAPKYHYSKKDERTQIIAKEKYIKFLQNLELLLDKAHPDKLKKIRETDKGLLRFMEQSKAPASPEAGKNYYKKEILIFKEFINLFKKENSSTIIVPDTNALIQFPEPTSYRKLISSPFTFLILPTVLSELDKLKINHRNEEFRNKAKSIVNRLKGYRKQGNVLEGVIVDKTITIKMVATEPDFSKTLKWLDPDNLDDRIVANALDIQIQNPSDRVILFTSDINLQNKSQLANLTVADTDDL